MLKRLTSIMLYKKVKCILDTTFTINPNNIYIFIFYNNEKI